jgi:prepilin-type N-terminal cleavage/methylation domain-containing protein
MFKRLKSNDGFTLIEIVAVLIIMGILAAVAVPRFFNLQSRAREKVIYTAVSELKVRVKQCFARQLLDGRTPDTVTYEVADVGIDLGNDYLVENWDATDDVKITFDITYYPDTADHTKNPLTMVGLTLTKPVTE